MLVFVGLWGRGVARALLRCTQLDTRGTGGAGHGCCCWGVGLFLPLAHEVIRDMPWWAAVYSVFIAAVCGLSAVADWRGRQRPSWHIGLDIASGIALVFLIAAAWYDQLVAPLGRAAALLFAVLLIWDIYSTSRDLADLKQDPELTVSENVWVESGGILVAAVVVAPAYALALMGVVVGWRAA
jgi:hypothetical protein